MRPRVSKKKTSETGIEERRFRLIDLESGVLYEYFSNNPSGITISALLRISDDSNDHWVDHADGMCKRLPRGSTSHDLEEPPVPLLTLEDQLGKPNQLELPAENRGNSSWNSLSFNRCFSSVRWRSAPNFLLRSTDNARCPRWQPDAASRFATSSRRHHAWR